MVIVIIYVVFIWNQVAIDKVGKQRNNTLLNLNQFYK